MLNKVEFIREFTSALPHYNILQYKPNDLVGFYIDMLYVTNKEDNMISSVCISLIHINLENIHKPIRNKYVFNTIEEAYDTAYDIHLNNILTY